jgi:2-polyprenyl-3-methyl-5-hydroxy-6-metoxy-1,4-benzoquinol methylase
MAELSRARADFDAEAYWQQRLQAHPGLTGVGFTTLGQRYNEWQYRLRRRIFQRAAARLDLEIPSARIVDVGSGTGFYISCWKELGAGRITGIDFTEFAVSRLKTAFPEDEFRRLDIGEAGAFERLGRADVVSCFDVLFHVVDEQRFANALGNIFSTLVPGGWFLFSDVFVHSATRQSCTHMVSRSLESVETLVRGVGFEIVERTPMFVTMNMPLDARSSLQQWLWRAVTYPAGKSEPYGYVLGAVLYPIDLALTRLLSEGPTTEVMICRKPACEGPEISRCA